MRTNERINLDNVEDTYFGGERANVDKHKRDAEADAAVVDAFKSLGWRELAFDVHFNSKGERTCFVLLPKHILAAIKAANAHFRYAKFGTWVDNTPDYLMSETVFMKTDSAHEFQRSHFPDGIPNALRGLSIGAKLYRALLHLVGYMRSDLSADPGAVRSWMSMVKDKLDGGGSPTEEHVGSMMLGTTVLALDPSLPDGQKLEVAKRFLDEYGSLVSSRAGRVFDVDPTLKKLLDGAYPGALDKFSPDSRAKAWNERQSRYVAGLGAADLENYQRNIKSYTVSGIDNHDWSVGDFVVLRRSVDRLMLWKPTVLQVVGRDGDRYVAVDWRQVDAYRGNPAHIAIRTTSDKAQWVKAKDPRSVGTNVHESYEQFLAERVNPESITDTYLGRLHASHKALERTPSAWKSIQDSDDIVRLFAALDWRTIDFQLQQSVFANMNAMVLLPRHLVEAIEEKTAASGDPFYYGEWVGMKGVADYRGIRLQYEPGDDDMQRTHFQSGIPDVLRGIGFGVKLYRALLEKIGYLRSGGDAKVPAQRSWLSLVRNKLEVDGSPLPAHVHSIVLGDNVLAISPTAVTDEKKVAVAKKFIETFAGLYHPGGGNFDVDPLLRKLLTREDASLMAKFSNGANERVDFSALDHTYLGKRNSKNVQQRDMGETRAAGGGQPPEAGQHDPVIEMFRQLAWDELGFDADGGDHGDDTVTYTVLLPDELLAAIAASKRSDKRYYGEWEGMPGATAYAVFIAAESDANMRRSHFINGIPEVLRGIGFGLKIYRAFLHTVGYMTSASDAKPAAQNAWISLVRNYVGGNDEPLARHVNSIVLGDNVLAIEPTLTGGQKVEIALRFLHKYAGHYLNSGGTFDVDPVLRKLLDAAAPDTMAQFRAKPLAEREAEWARARQTLLKAAAHKIRELCFTDEENHGWEVGDYVVVESELLDDDEDSPTVYRVYKQKANSWYAIPAGQDDPGPHEAYPIGVVVTPFKGRWVKAKKPAVGELRVAESYGAFIGGTSSIRARTLR